jgi:hypothetical protein
MCSEGVDAPCLCWLMRQQCSILLCRSFLGGHCVLAPVEYAHRALWFLVHGAVHHVLLMPCPACVVLWHLAKEDSYVERTIKCRCIAGMSVVVLQKHSGVEVVVVVEVWKHVQDSFRPIWSNHNFMHIQHPTHVFVVRSLKQSVALSGRALLSLLSSSLRLEACAR